MNFIIHPTSENAVVAIGTVNRQKPDTYIKAIGSLSAKGVASLAYINIKRFDSELEANKENFYSPARWVQLYQETVNKTKKEHFEAAKIVNLTTKVNAYLGALAERDTHLSKAFQVLLPIRDEDLMFEDFIEATIELVHIIKKPTSPEKFEELVLKLAGFKGYISEPKCVQETVVEAQAVVAKPKRTRKAVAK